MKRLVILTHLLAFCLSLSASAQDAASAQAGGFLSDPELSRPPADSPELEVKKSQMMQDLGLLIEAGALEQAIELSQSMVETYPESIYARIMQARVLGAAGKLEASRELLASIARENPEEAEAIVHLADVCLQLQDHDGARRAYEMLAHINPNAPQLSLGLGLIAERDGDISKAIEHYRRGVLLAPPNYVGLKTNLARLYNITGSYRRTVRLLQDIVASGHANLEAHRYLAVAYLGLSEVDQALEVYEGAAELFPDEDFAFDIGVVQKAAGNTDAAVDLLKRYLERNPQELDVYFELSRAYTDGERHAESVQVAKDALARFGRSERTLLRLGEALWASGEKESADDAFLELRSLETLTIRTVEKLSAYDLSNARIGAAKKLWERASSFHTTNPVPSYRLGELAQVEGDSKAALAAYSEALERAPGDLSIMLKLISLHRGLAEFDEAVALAKRASSDHPENANLRLMLAELHLLNGQQDQSVTAYHQVLASDAGNVVALNNLANLYADMGRLSLAESKAREALVQAPASAAVMDTLGWILVRSGKLEEGRGLLEAAFDAQSSDPAIAYHLGEALLAVGDVAKARLMYESALAQELAFDERAAAESRLRELNR